MNMSYMMMKDRYPGTHPFSGEEQKIFFGRDEDIENFSQLVLLERQIVLFGKSGLGKSSLLNAGVVPKLGEKDNYEAFQVRFNSYTPDKEDTPSDILRTKISEHINYDNFLWNKVIHFHPDRLESMESVPNLEILSDLWYYLKSLQIRNTNKNIFVVVLDQFEELFTYPDEQVNTFSRELANLVNVRVPQFVRDHIRNNKTGNDVLTAEESQTLFRPLNIKIIISIRSDKMSLLNKLKDYNPEILQKTYELRPLEIHQAREAILQPAGLQDSETLKFNSPPFEYSTTALDAMVAFLSKGGQQKIETFQLQILCKYAENKSLGKTEEPRVITAEDLGKVEDIFENYYDDRISMVPVDQQLKVRKFIEEGLIFEEDQRRLSIYEGQAERQYDISSELLSQLVETRLIRTEPYSAGGFSYEISHDTLVAPILKAKARRLLQEKHEEDEKLRKEEEEKKILIWKERQRKLNRRYKTAGLVVISICLTLAALFIYIWDAKKEADMERNNARNALEKLMTSLRDNAIMKYDTKLKDGKDLQDDKKYQEAMQLYRKALEEVREYNASIDSPAAKIDTIQALKFIENCQNQEVLSIGFYSLLNSGDSLARIGPEYFNEAKQQYNLALGMDIDNEQAQQKISLLNAKIDTEAGKYIANAELFLAKGYKNYALEWLIKAQKIKGKDPKIESLMAQCK